jgi:hypothetical protein
MKCLCSAIRVHGTFYRRLLMAVHLSEVFSGFCYTQFADALQETNGLFEANRRGQSTTEVSD